MRSATTARRAAALAAALALCLCALAGCSAGGEQEEGSAVPEVVEPLEPVAAPEPAQDLGGESGAEAE